MKIKIYLDVKTIKVSDLIAEYMVKLFFQENTPPLFNNGFVRIIELDKMVNNYLSEIFEEEIESYIDSFNEQNKLLGFRKGVVFAFVSDNFTAEPLRLYLNSYVEGEKLCIEDFSLASNYYLGDLEKNTFNIY